LKTHTFFWSAETTSAIKEYLSLEASAKRDRLFEKSILPAINTIISIELNQLKLATSEDLRQDATIKALEVFSLITDWQSAQAFVTTAIRRYIRQYAMRKNPLTKYNDQSNESDLVLARIVDNEAPLLESKEEKATARQRFICDIREKIEEQKVLNSTRVAILSLLIDYAEANDYEMAGFIPYCSDTLKLSVSYIRSVSSTLDIKCKPLM
jgi:uncharacterized protein with ATP-grasp and redox domains